MRKLILSALAGAAALAFLASFAPPIQSGGDLPSIDPSAMTADAATLQPAAQADTF